MFACVSWRVSCKLRRSTLPTIRRRRGSSNRLGATSTVDEHSIDVPVVNSDLRSFWWSSDVRNLRAAVKIAASQARFPAKNNMCQPSLLDPLVGCLRWTKTSRTLTGLETTTSTICWLTATLTCLEITTSAICWLTATLTGLETITSAICLRCARHVQSCAQNVLRCVPHVLRCAPHV